MLILAHSQSVPITVYQSQQWYLATTLPMKVNTAWLTLARR